MGIGCTSRHVSPGPIVVVIVLQDRTSPRLRRRASAAAPSTRLSRRTSPRFFRCSRGHAAWWYISRKRRRATRACGGWLREWWVTARLRLFFKRMGVCISAWPPWALAPDRLSRRVDHDSTAPCVNSSKVRLSTRFFSQPCRQGYKNAPRPRRRRPVLAQAG